MGLKDKSRLFYNCSIRENGLVSPFKRSTMGYNNPVNLSVYTTVYDFISLSFFDYNIKIPHIVALVYDGTNFLLTKFRIDEYDAPDSVNVILHPSFFIDYVFFNNNYYFSADQINIYITNTNKNFSSLTTPPILESGEQISCISTYGGRLVCGGNEGNLYFSKIGTDDFTITGTITDGLKIPINGIPKCIKNVNDTIIILCANGDIYYLKGDLLSTDDSILKKITTINFGSFFYPTTRSMINSNSRLFVFSENGILELYRDIYTDSFKMNLKNDMFKKYWSYIFSNWDSSINYLLRTPSLRIYNDNMINIFSDYVGGRNESILYDMYDDNYIILNNELADTFKYASMSENLKYVDYGSGVARYYQLSDLSFSSEYSYLYFKPSLVPEVKSYNAVAKISYIPTIFNFETVDINLYYNDKLLGTINEAVTSNWTELRDNIKTRRLNISNFDGSGQYYLKFKNCEIVDFTIS